MKVLGSGRDVEFHSQWVPGPNLIRPRYRLTARSKSAGLRNGRSLSRESCLSCAVPTLGILSDTHGYFHPNLPDDLAGVDHILHAGDVGDLSILDGLEAVAPVTAVWGNIDDSSIRRRLSEHRRFEVEGLDVWMTHIAGRPGRWQRDMGDRLSADPPDMLVCGHSHILRVERVAPLNNMLYVNPGAAGKQGFHREKTCLRLTVDEGRATEAAVVHLDREAPSSVDSTDTPEL